MIQESRTVYTLLKVSQQSSPSLLIKHNLFIDIQNQYPQKNLMILYEYHLVQLPKQPIFFLISMISKESHTSITAPIIFFFTNI